MLAEPGCDFNSEIAIVNSVTGWRPGLSSTAAISKRFHFRAIAAAALITGLLQPGTALAAQSALRIKPASLNFGREVFAVSGAAGNPEPVTISNPKTKAALPLTIANFSIGGPNSGDFSVADPNIL